MHNSHLKGKSKFKGGIEKLDSDSSQDDGKDNSRERRRQARLEK